MMIALAVAAPPPASVQGFVEVRGSWAAGADGTPWQLVERFRPTFDAPLSDRALLSTTVEAALSQGRDLQTELQRALESSELGPLLDVAQCTWPVDDNTLFHTNEVGDYLFVDRLTLDVYQPGFDVRIGRQALQWGSALFVNPTDPFPQVLFTEPWRPRAGVNAARVSVPLSSTDHLQAVVGTNEDFDAARIAGRATVNRGGADLAAVAAWRQESDEVVTGVDIKGTWIIGYWVEAALRIGDVSTGQTSTTADAAIGVDYSIPVLDTVYVAAQYLRNGAVAAGASPITGVDGPTCAVDVPLAAEAGDPDPFAPFLSGRDYVLTTARLGLHPQLSVSATWLQNLGDGTAVVVPGANWALPQQFDLSLTAQVPARTWGDGGEFSPNADDLVLSVPGVATADLSGLVPDATVVLWTRKTF